MNRFQGFPLKKFKNLCDALFNKIIFTDEQTADKDEKPVLYFN